LAGRSRPSADFATAEQYYAEALANAHRVGARSLQLRATKGLARVWHRHGKAKEARGVLAPTIIQGRITALAA